MPPPRPSRLALVLALGLAPQVASAGGLVIPDLGGAALAQGGAFAARPDDLSAIYYNPAGLALVPGLRLELGGRRVNLDTSFTRAETDFHTFDTVRNGGGASLAPLVGVTYRLEPAGVFPIAIAAGLFPYPGYTGARYPDPAKLRADDPDIGSDELASKTGQRYSAISADVVIVAPTIGLAAQPTRWLALGAMLQLSYAKMAQKQAIHANPGGALTSESGEDPRYDAIFGIEGETAPTVSGLLGATFVLPADLSLGLALQLPTYFQVKGKLSAELSDFLTDAGAALVGDAMTLELTMPSVARAGLRWVRPAGEVELGATWEAWSMQSSIWLRPHDVGIKQGDKVTPLEDIEIRNGYVDSGSVRLGGVFRPGVFVDALRILVLRAGALYETSAVPSSQQSLATPHWDRLVLTGGFGVEVERFTFSLSYAHSFQAPRTVTDTAVQQVVASPKTDTNPDGITPTLVGNGVYTTQLQVLTASVGYRFDLGAAPAPAGPPTGGAQ